jgi:hypothetical protein
MERRLTAWVVGGCGSAMTGAWGRAELLRLRAARTVRMPAMGVVMVRFLSCLAGNVLRPRSSPGGGSHVFTACRTLWVR